MAGMVLKLWTTGAVIFYIVSLANDDHVRIETDRYAGIGLRTNLWWGRPPYLSGQL